MVNVSVENLAPCKKLLRIEVDGPRVEEVFVAVARDFRRQAHVPGFRPGKVSRDQVERMFAKEIRDEVRRKLLSESYAQAIKQQKVHPIGNPDVEVLQFERGQTLQYTVTIETAPDFELPDYKGLPVRVAPTVVTQADQDRALTVLREQKATYLDVDRSAQIGDFAVINYSGTCEGTPLADLAATAKSLAEQKGFWLRLAMDTSFIPGFVEQIQGAKTGDHRTVSVTFPANFAEPKLAGKTALYEVDVVQVKERILPEINDDFARSYGAQDMDALREGVRRDLQNELNQKQRNSVRNQLVRALLNRVTCQLPESVLQAETRHIVYDIVRDQQERGIDRQNIDQHKQEIYSLASSSAKDRVKLAFLLGRIAEKEDIEATREEIDQRIALLAAQHQMRPEKLRRQLEERDTIDNIADEIVRSKVLDFLQLHARIEELPAGSPAPE